MTRFLQSAVCAGESGGHAETCGGHVSYTRMFNNHATEACPKEKIKASKASNVGRKAEDTCLELSYPHY